MKAFAAAHPTITGTDAAVEFLAGVDEGTFRDVVGAAALRRERAAAARENREPADGGRLRVRWGRYDPRA